MKWRRKEEEEVLERPALPSITKSMLDKVFSKEPATEILQNFKMRSYCKKAFFSILLCLNSFSVSNP